MASISAARSRPADLETSWCARIASTSWSPIRWNGCKEDSGSWKIIAISSPRTLRSSSSSIASRSRPSKRTWPPNDALRERVKPRIVRFDTLLPDPDSPTIPSERPASTENETPSTAPTTPSSVMNFTDRSLTSSSGAISSAPAGRGRRR